MAADVLARGWWLFVLRGVVAVTFGALAIFWPGITLVVLVLMFGAYALVDGVMAIVSGLRKRETEPRWWALVIEGLAGVGIGVITFIWPNVTALVLLYFIAAWAIITGILEIAEAIRLRKEIQGEFWLALGGLASVIFGVVLLLFPGAGALSVVWLIAAYAIIFGVVLIVLGFRLRGWTGRGERSTAQPA